MIFFFGVRGPVGSNQNSSRQSVDPSLPSARTRHYGYIALELGLGLVTSARTSYQGYIQALVLGLVTKAI